MRTFRVLVVVLMAVAGFVGCGTTGDGEATATTVARDDGSTAGDVTTTEGADDADGSDDGDDDSDDFEFDFDEDDPDAVYGPFGDEKLFPLLLEPTDFHPDFVYGNANSNNFEDEFCEGVSPSVTSQAMASMTADLDPDLAEDDFTFMGASQGILAYNPGDAARFMAEVPEMVDACEDTEDSFPAELETVSGLGDGAFRFTEPPTSDDLFGFGVDLVIIRVGDNVVLMVKLLNETGDEMSDDLLATAVNRARSN